MSDDPSRPEPESARQRWQRVEALVDALLDVPPAEREAHAGALSGADLELAAEALRIIAAGERPHSLDAPLVRIAADLLPREAAGHTLPARIGPYRIVRELGHGGMGAVYLAERDDGEFRQTVAVKLVRRGLHHDPRAVRRFRDERQTLAALQHRDIGRLLDGGVTADGLPYFAMDFIDGRPIDRYCDEERLSVDARLVLFARICEAVAYAHERGIIHRDIKPSNILVTADGEPRLLDFGIAKLVAPDQATDLTHVTRTGERLLTPEYASPEQLLGREVSAASDVYGLGVLLFELLTGQRPFGRRRLSPHEIERATLEEPPTRPSTVVTRRLVARDDVDPSSVDRACALRASTPERLKQRLRGDLDSIVLQSLRKEPERRYATAAELGADIRRHLRGQRVQARGDSLVYRARVWSRRHRRTVVAGVAGMTIGVAALGSVAFREWRDDRWLDARGLSDEVSTRSLAARRYYEDGLRAYAHGHLIDALRLFRSALAADSTFAMAAFYGSAAAQLAEDYVAARDLLELSYRHAGSASDRERLTVLANYAAFTRDASLHAYADSLNRRFPSTALGSLWSANAAFLAGDWMRAITEAQRVIALDSLALRESLVPCHACEALIHIVNAYIHADSLQAAEHAAGAAIRRMPQSAAAWRYLSLVHLWNGVTTDSAYRRVIALSPDDADFAAEWLADAHLRRGNFHDADAVLHARRQTAAPARVERWLGLLVVSMRMQERWAEAMEYALQFRALQEPDTGIVMARHVAIVLMDSGRPREAAALFDSISRWTGQPGGTDASFRIWHLTHRATSLAMAGDTAALPLIADSIRALAPRSGNGRDARLAHHVDGLLLAARGDDEAAAAAFRRAIQSWNRGYTRTNYELARALLRLGRPHDAVAALQPAFRGSLEVNNSYVTHTALHRLLAEAWRAAGSPDSAAAHHAWVARAVAAASR